MIRCRGEGEKQREEGEEERCESHLALLNVVVRIPTSEVFFVVLSPVFPLF